MLGSLICPKRIRMWPRFFLDERIFYIAYVMHWKQIAKYIYLWYFNTFFTFPQVSLPCATTSLPCMTRAPSSGMLQIAALLSMTRHRSGSTTGWGMGARLPGFLMGEGMMAVSLGALSHLPRNTVVIFVICKLYVCLVWERTFSVFGIQFKMNLTTFFCHILEKKALWCRWYFE